LVRCESSPKIWKTVVDESNSIISISVLELTELSASTYGGSDLAS